MAFSGIGKLWGTQKKGNHLKYGQQAGMKTCTMTESSFLEKISAYMAENKRQATLEAEITNMANKATYGEIYNTGPGEYSKPKTPDEQVPVEPTKQRLAAIYNEEPLGFEKDPIMSSA